MFWIYVVITWSKNYLFSLSLSTFETKSCTRYIELFNNFACYSLQNTYANLSAILHSNMSHFSHIVINVCGRNGKNFAFKLWSIIVVLRSTLTLHHCFWRKTHIQNFSLPCHAIIQSKRNYVFNIQEKRYLLHKDLMLVFVLCQGITNAYSTGCIYTKNTECKKCK